MGSTPQIKRFGKGRPAIWDSAASSPILPSATDPPVQRHVTNRWVVRLSAARRIAGVSDAPGRGVSRMQICDVLIAVPYLPEALIAHGTCVRLELLVHVAFMYSERPPLSKRYT